uniref:DUF6932 family protein n=1 Tax=Brevibacillus sp. FSL K6-2834 TaxID=2954680 RepID=UPI00406C1738
MSTGCNATHLFFGGSFITNKAKPHDIDCVMVFKEERYIPHKSERLVIDGTKLDITFCLWQTKNVGYGS